MRILGVWLLLLLAVLVPATASIVGVAVCPSLSPAKQAQMRLHERSYEMKAGKAALPAAKAHAGRMPGMQLASSLAASQPSRHATTKHTMTKPGAGVQTSAQTGVQTSAPTGTESATCDDCGTCTHCASCGSGASMLALAASPLLPLASEGSLLPEPAAQRAEFLSVGQERPPRLG